MSEEKKFKGKKPAPAVVTTTRGTIEEEQFRLCVNVPYSLRNRVRAFCGKHDCFIQNLVSDAILQHIEKLEAADQKGTLYEDFDIAQYRLR